MKLVPTVAIIILIAISGAGFWVYYSSNAPVTGIDISDTKLIARGKILYAQECAACHGKNLEGQTSNWRLRLPDGSLPAPPHDVSGHTWHHPDNILFEVTKYGRLQAARTVSRSNMPAFGQKMTDEDIWAALSYIKSRWPEDVIQKHDNLNRRYRASR